MANTPSRTVRVDDKTWDAFDKVARALGTNRASMVIRYIEQVCAGEILPLAPTPRKWGDKPYISVETWEQIRSQVAKGVAEAVRHMDNPMPRLVVARTSEAAQMPQAVVPQIRPGSTRNKGRQHLRNIDKATRALAPLDKESCNHDPNQHARKTILGKTFCTCGQEITLEGVVSG